MEQLEKTNRDIDALRNLLERRMRSTIRDQMARSIFHEFGNNISEMSLAIQVLKHEFQKLKMVHQKNRIVGAFHITVNLF